MNRQNTAEILPLWSWAVVAAIIILFLLSAYPVAAVIEDQKYSNAEYLNLTRLVSRDVSRPIIVLGSSLTRNAIYYDDEMQDKLRDKGVENNFVRITASAARKSSFEGVLPLILKSAPAVVLIELEMLLVDRSVKLDAARYTLMQNIQIIYMWLKQVLLGISLGHAENIFPNNYGFEEECKNEYSSEDKYPEVTELSQHKFKVYEEFLSKPWLDFIENIHRNGGKVVILEVGRSSYASKGLTSRFMIDYESSIQKLKEFPSLIHWRFPGPFTVDNYCDFAHLNNQGGANFVNWIIPQLRSLLND